VELVQVGAQIAFDLLEPHGREVVRLNRPAQVDVDLVDLTQDTLRLRLLRSDRARVAGRAGGGQQGDREGDEKRLRLPNPRGMDWA
jgi:hypothetical protein